LNKQVIFIDGPIGSGKSTLGSELALRLGGHFIDGDDCCAQDMAWYTSALTTCHSIVREVLSAMQNCSLVIVAQPLRSREWIFFKGTFSRKHIAVSCIGLKASYSSIVAAHRKRAFSGYEHQRIQVMIAEGYGQRPFSIMQIDSGKSDFEATLLETESKLREQLGFPADLL